MARQMKHVRYFPYRHCWALTRLELPRELLAPLQIQLCADLGIMSDNHTTFYFEGKRSVWWDGLGSCDASKGLFITFSDGACYIGSTAWKGQYWDREDEDWLTEQDHITVE